MPALDYSDAVAMMIGARKASTEYWVGDLGNVVIRAGAYPPAAPNGGGTDPLEISALRIIHDKCSGDAWE